MKKRNKTIKSKEVFEISPSIMYSDYYTTVKGISAKSWYPQDEKNTESSQWLLNDINIILYSTGLCKLNFLSSNENTSYSWGVRFLDIDKNELKSINFAPLFIDSSKGKKARSIKLEHRVKEISESLIEDTVFIQLVNFQ